MTYETHLNVQVVETEEVYRKYQIREFANPNGEQTTNKMINKADKKVTTIVYTDGKLIGVDSKVIDVDEYYIKGKKYDGLVTHLIIKNLHIANASYVVKIIIADEVLDISNRGKGIFKVIKDIKIQIKDKKDKEALKKAKETVNSIRDEYKSNNSIWDIFFKKQTKGSLIYESVGDDIYTLKQRTR